MIDKINYKQIYELFVKKNYKFFTKPFDLNIFGVRSANRVADSFDDVLGVAYTDSNGSPKIFKCMGTVDPGSYFLKNLMDKGGAAAIVPGQYRRVWKLGYFKAMPALIQVRPFSIYRDDNLDDILDLEGNKITTGLYGLLMHESFQRLEEPKRVANSSAGCVVPQRKRDHSAIIKLCYQQITAGLGDEYTFTLFDESDLL